MGDSAFRFIVELHRGAVLVGRATADPGPCVEDALFRAVLSGALPNDGSVPPITVTPIWESAGPPAVTGLRVTLAGGQESTYGAGLFDLRARILLSEALRDRRLEAGQEVTWRAVTAEQRPAPAPRFRARASRAPYPFERARLQGVAPGELAVIVEPAVIADIREKLRAARTVECAGLLVGHLLHDLAAGAATVLVTDSLAVPAGAGGASRAHFSFAPDSFAAARRALAGRPDRAIAAGWWHSHPACARCTERPDCNADTVFFSTSDAQVHLSAFSAAYMTALVAGKVAGQPATDPGFRCYGWGGGTIAEQTLRVSAAGNRARPSDDVASEGASP